MKTDQKVIGRVLLGLLVISFACGVAASGQAAEAASFYKGKTITFLVSNAPGGGFDLIARMIAPFLEKETGANVVVSNMPGGEGYIAIRYLYNAKPDGLNILITGSYRMVLAELLGDPRAKGMEVKKFIWLARVDYQPQVLLLSKKFPYRSLDDLKAAKQTITSPTSGAISSAHLSLAFLAEAIGLDAKIIPGFGGSSEETLAFMRGEVSCHVLSTGSAVEEMKNPEIFPLVTLGLKRTKLLPDLPAINELVTLSPEHVRWFQRLDNMLGLERPIFTAPGVPVDRVEFLRAALGRVLNNKEFLAVAERSRRPINYLPGAEVEKMVNELLSMSGSEIKELKTILDKHIMRSLTK